MTVRRSAGILRIFGQELPGPVDRLALEVVAEAEVAQHLEERLVERRLADVLDVAGADALLAGRGALEARVAQAHELALELVHPGRREQHRRVVGHEHVARPADAALGGEEVEVGFAKFVGGHGNCGIEGRINWVAAEDRLITWLCDRARPARAGRGRARSEWAWTAPVIVQDEEPGGNPGSVRTQGGFLPAQLHFAASLTFLPQPAGFQPRVRPVERGARPRWIVAVRRRCRPEAGYPWPEKLGAATGLEKSEKRGVQAATTPQ